MLRRIRKFSALLLFTILTVGESERLAHPTAQAHNAVSAAEVQIDNFSFTPEALTVKAGTTITWTNRDDIPHTVVSSDQEFKSKALDTDDKFTASLTKPGSYTYFCSIHPKMTGKIVVE